MKNLDIYDKKLVNSLKWLIVAFFVIGVFFEPALAANWSDKIKGVADEGVNGLKVIGSAVALGCLLWSAYQIIWGGKRLQDMVGWFIGAIIAFAAEDIVSMFFK